MKLKSKECKKVLEDINPVLAGSDFDSDTVTILKHELSFYPGYCFLDVADYEIVPLFRKFVIYKSGKSHVSVLDGTNKPLYDLNDKVPLSLTEENVADYVRFFFSYVRGPHGRFIVAENIDDIKWRAEPPSVACKAIGKKIFPVTMDGKDDNGSFHLKASLLFKGALFNVSIFITKNGRVTLSNEELLIDEMPVLDDIFEQ